MLRKGGKGMEIEESALRHWDKENLEVEVRGDRLVACFSYTGSTCTNGGTQFRARLFVEIERDGSDPRVLNARIEVPECGRAGASAMCAFRSQGEAFFSSLGEPPSFVGKRISEALGRLKNLNYAGCFCQEPMRSQKWEMVLATLRYRLNR
jgi:hypothetical protein